MNPGGFLLNIVGMLHKCLVFAKRLLAPALPLVFTAAALPLSAQTPFNITGITGDRTSYNNSLTFTVPTEPGYTYGVYVNGTNVSAGGSYTLTPDFYLVQAFRTNTATSAVTNRYFRIIVMDNANRGDTERGLPTHTPLIAIPSSSQEFAGVWLRVIAPRRFPAGYEIPIVAWAYNPQQGKTMRGNGWLTFPVWAGEEAHFPQPPIFLRRGVGSGFLSSDTPAGSQAYGVSLGDHAYVTNLFVTVQDPTTWTPVSGTLSGNITWPADSRIHVTAGTTLTAGSTLTIGAGTIVRLNPGVTITNNGNVTINGTHHEPVVFMPNSRSQYWGGFQMRSGEGVVNATWTIFTGSGAAQNWLGGHRSEQPLFDDNQSLTLTDCALIYTAGQFLRDGGTIRLDRVLVQGVTSAGEFSGASLRVNDSAFIEVPDDSSNFVNLDNDALYLNNGNHGFTNTLFGWTKDDGIDSGGGGSGTIHYVGCWFESIFHEANSLSGTKNVYPIDTVYIDCGQGHESGYDAPNGFVDGCLFLANKSGLRHGDNYTSMSGYGGLLTSSNSILLYNHRDVFGYNWDSPGGWTNASGQMNIRDNWLTKPDTNFPDNAVWNPASDGWRLARFSTAPGDANVGVGMALRGPQVTIAQLTNGVPVRLSTFSTNFVLVDYAIENADATLASGTLQFVPGEIVKYVRATPSEVQNQSLIRVRLHNPVRADITANPVAFYSVGVTQAPPQLILPANAVWKYPSTAGAQPASWTNLTFNDASWLAGPAQLGFSEGEEDDEATLIADFDQITYYFRRVFNVDDPRAFASLAIDMIRDDGGRIYINGVEVFRSPNLPAPPAVISFTTPTLSGQNGENTRDQATTIAPLVAGQNIAAVEIHQQNATSSDVSFSLRLDGLPAPRLELRQFRGDWLLFWADPAFKLQQADTLAGPWTTLQTPSPVPVDLSAASRFYRLVR